MKLRYLPISLIFIGVLPAAGLHPDPQSAGQDMKDAGNKTTSAVKKGTKKSTKAVKKGANKAADETEKGANKMKHKTSDTSND